MNELLWLTRSKFSKDPRDRIYSLLGLVHGRHNEIFSGSLLAPDYTKSIRYTFAAATKMTILLDRTLEILHLKNHTTDDSLPSWTPNFSIPMAHCFPPLC